VASGQGPPQRRRSTIPQPLTPDPTGHDPLAFYLAYLHPLWMLASLVLAAATLRAGLALRRARRLGQRRSAELYRRHLRLAKPTLVLLVVGFAGGIASSVLLRGWDALASTHGRVGCAALAALLAAGALGRRLEHGERGAVEWHARLAALSVLLAAAAIGTGFVLLP
jgi:hypothetical protein